MKRTALRGSTYALADCFEAVYILKYDFESLLNYNLSINILTDSESLSKIMVKYTTTTEKRLLIDVWAAQEMLEKGEICKIRWIGYYKNAANDLRHQIRFEALKWILNYGVLNTTVEQ